MDLENQKRVKALAEQYGPENIIVSLGAAEGEAAGPLAGVQLGLKVFHACEPEIKDEVDSDVYDEQISMMEMVLDVDDIRKEMSAIRDEHCKY